MIYEHSSYRAYLKTELADRIAKNESYSLRAFSQKLGFSHSFVSEVLQGKKTLSSESAFKVALKLGLSESETHYLCLLVQLELEKDVGARESIESKLKEMNPKRATLDLSIELFRAISDWYHFGILELSSLKGFELTPASAAKKLSITKAEADAAIDRLLRLELLERKANGKLRKAPSYVQVQSTVPNGAIKSFHKQILAKAAQAIDAQLPHERVSLSDVIPIDESAVEQVRKLSDQMAAEVLKISEKSKKRDRIYSLSVQFFSLSPERKSL